MVTVASLTGSSETKNEFAADFERDSYVQTTDESGLYRPLALLEVPVRRVSGPPPWSTPPARGPGGESQLRSVQLRSVQLRTSRKPHRATVPDCHSGETVEPCDL